MSLPKINIERINERFGRFGEFLLAHRVVLLVAFVVLLAVSIVGMKKIYVEASWDSYFIEGDPMLVETDKFKETFGNDYFVGVLVESDHSILTPDNLKLLRGPRRNREAPGRQAGTCKEADFDRPQAGFHQHQAASLPRRFRVESRRRSEGREGRSPRHENGSRNGCNHREGKVCTAESARDRHALLELREDDLHRSGNGPHFHHDDSLRHHRDVPRDAFAPWHCLAADYDFCRRHHDLRLGGLSRALHGCDQHHGARDFGLRRFNCIQHSHQLVLPQEHDAYGQAQRIGALRHA